MQSNKGALKKPSRPDISSRKSTASDSVKVKATPARPRDPSKDRNIKNKEFTSTKNVTSDQKASVTGRHKIEISKSKPTRELTRRQTTLGTNSNVSTRSKQNNSQTVHTKPTVSKQNSNPNAITTTVRVKKQEKDNTSSRVTTTQYFPKKYYEKQNARVQSQENISKPTTLRKISSEQNNINTKRDRTKKSVSDTKLTTVRSRSRTLSPSEIKIVKGPEDNPPKKDYIKERDLRKLTAIAVSEPKVVDVEPEVVVVEPPQPTNEGYDYEDDFDSYESDFEPYSSSASRKSTSASSSTSSLRHSLSRGISSSSSSSSNSSSDNEKVDSFQEMVTSASSSAQKRIQNASMEEERKLDSGNYDLRDPKRVHLLHGIKEAIERENSIIGKQLNQERREGSLSDEGFDESALKPLSATKHRFIDFNTARKREQHLKYLKKSKERGRDILNMITLDSIYVSLFEMLPVPYEMYMQNYGRRGTLQMHSQTNDDDFTEEIQTDEIETANKWTQHPIEFLDNCKTNDDLLILNRIQKGAGDDKTKVVVPEEWREKCKYNQDHLTSFMQSAGQVMITLLDEVHKKYTKQLKNSEDFPFSCGYTRLGVDAVPFLANRSIRTVEYSNEQSHLLLTVHDGHASEFMNYEQELLSRPMMCLWNTLEPSIPLKILFICEPITSCCFNHGKTNTVFAGLKNGSVCVWDLREPAHVHTNVKDELDATWTLRSPTYITVPIQEYSSQVSEIVTIKCLILNENIDTDVSTVHYTPLPQVCTLNLVGHIIIWSVTYSHKSPSQITPDQGLAPWGRIRLVASISVNLTYLLPELDTELQCFDFQLDSEDPNTIYIATNSGHVIHCLTTGTKTIPKLYTSDTENNSQTTCIETCPFGKPYFLVGCVDGSIRLHSRQVEKSLITLYGSDDSNSNIKIIQWSKLRPCHIFTVDNADIMHIWDLESSDIYPIMSVPLGDKVSAVKFLSYQNKKLNHMVLAFENGRIEIHEVHSDFAFQSMQELSQELNKFLLYVNIL